jgi:hypothetical protein
MQPRTNTLTHMLCNITCFTEDSSLLGYDALLVEYFPMFLWIIVPSKCWNYAPENIASNPR